MTEQILQINTIGRIELPKATTPQNQPHILKKVKYRRRILEPMKKNLSNNIRDYLSVARISMRELAEKEPINQYKSTEKSNKFSEKNP